MGNNFTQEDRQKLNILVNVLENGGVPVHYYNIGGYADDAVCIEKDDELWLSYIGSKGEKSLLESFVHFENVGLSAINRLAYTDEQLLNMHNDFIARLQVLENSDEMGE